VAANDRTPPSLEIIEVHMPVMGGGQVIEQIRQRGLNFPIVVMSSDPDLVERARDWGPVKILPKPFDVAHLLQIIESCLAA
jgi:CheY-like chemotaxis protein